MDSLKKAKDFLAKKASKLALAAVPLAALAVAPPAHAGAILAGATLATNGGCAVFTSVSGAGTCTLVQAGNPGGNPNLNWVQMFGSASTGTAAGFIDFGTSGSSASGDLPAGMYTFSWDFTLTSTPSETVSWNIFGDLIGGVNDFFFNRSGSGTTTQHVVGSASVNVTTGIGLTSWDFGVNTSTTGTSTYTLTVPGGATLDVNAVTGVPEPSTAAFMLTSIGGLALLVRRKKRQS